MVMMMFQMQRCLHEMVGMLQQQQQEMAELRSEMARQRAVVSNVNQLTVQLDSLSTCVTERVAELLEGQHQLDCILYNALIAISHTLTLL